MIVVMVSRDQGRLQGTARYIKSSINPNAILHTVIMDLRYSTSTTYYAWGPQQAGLWVAVEAIYFYFGYFNYIDEVRQARLNQLVR